MKSIEEMQSELSKAGYTGEWVYSGNGQAFLFVFSNSVEVSDWDKDKAIKAAYAYLKQVQFLDELARLRDDCAAYRKKELESRQNGNSLEARKMFEARLGIEKEIVRKVLSWEGDSDE